MNNMKYLTQDEIKTGGTNYMPFSDNGDFQFSANNIVSNQAIIKNEGDCHSVQIESPGTGKFISVYSKRLLDTLIKPLDNKTQNIVCSINVMAIKDTIINFGENQFTIKANVWTRVHDLIKPTGRNALIGFVIKEDQNYSEKLYFKEYQVELGIVPSDYKRGIKLNPKYANVNFLKDSNDLLVGNGNNGVVSTKLPTGEIKIVVPSDSLSLQHTMLPTASYAPIDELKNGDNVVLGYTIRSEEGNLKVPQIYLKAGITYDTGDYITGIVTKNYNFFSCVKPYSVLVGNSNIHLRFEKAGTYYLRELYAAKGDVPPANWSASPKDLVSKKEYANELQKLIERIDNLESK